LPWFRGNLFGVWLVVLWATAAAGQPDLEQGQGLGTELGMPGYLIMSSARDTTAGYQWNEGPGPDQISLSWRQGMLTVPGSLVLEEYSLADLAVPVSAKLTGAGASGSLEWRDGTYEINEPVLLSDGQVNLLVSQGQLEVVGSRIRYRPPLSDNGQKPADPRASFIMLAGILLLIGVLLRRARQKMNKGS